MDTCGIKLAMHKCDNCGKRFSEDELQNQWPNIPDLTLRIEPGNIVPSGECPSCGCLTYIVNASRLRRTQRTAAAIPS